MEKEKKAINKTGSAFWKEENLHSEACFPVDAPVKENEAEETEIQRLNRKKMKERMSQDLSETKWGFFRRQEELYLELLNKEHSFFADTPPSLSSPAPHSSLRLAKLGRLFHQKHYSLHFVDLRNCGIHHILNLSEAIQ